MQNYKLIKHPQTGEVGYWITVSGGRRVFVKAKKKGQEEVPPPVTPPPTGAPSKIRWGRVAVVVMSLMVLNVAANLLFTKIGMGMVNKRIQNLARRRDITPDDFDDIITDTDKAIKQAKDSVEKTVTDVQKQNKQIADKMIEGLDEALASLEQANKDNPEMLEAIKKAKEVSKIWEKEPPKKPK